MTIGGKTHQLRLEPPVPEVKILGPTDPETGLPIQIHHGPKMYTTSQVKAAMKREASPAPVEASTVASTTTMGAYKPLPPPPPPATLLPPPSSTGVPPTHLPELAPPPFMNQPIPALSSTTSAADVKIAPAVSVPTLPQQSTAANVVPPPPVVLPTQYVPPVEPTAAAQS